MEKTTEELNQILTKEYLVEEYYNKKQSINYLSKIVGCDFSTIKNRLIKFSIPVRGLKEVYTKEIRQKMGLSKLGKHYQTEESRLKISLAQKGKIISEKQKQKISQSLKGKHLTKEVKLRISQSNKGKPRLRGENHWNWKGGISSLVSLIYVLPENKIWRNKVFKRDNFICQKCFKIGGKLEAHHNKKLLLILKDFLSLHFNLHIKENKVQLLELARKYKPFWEVENGKTLCCSCHSLVEKEV